MTATGTFIFFLTDGAMSFNSDSIIEVDLFNLTTFLKSDSNIKVMTQINV